MKITLFLSIIIISLPLFFCNTPIDLKSEIKTKPRVIATTDGEVDDRCSMVRFLLYADQWDVEGLIYSSSKFHWKGYRWAGETWLYRDIDLYAQCYENLKQNSPDFPTPKHLRSKIYIGNIDSVGAMEHDTPGSDHIVKVLLDDDPRPVYLQAWGGTNTIARALWKIQHEYPDQMEKVSKKAILYIILDQDRTFRDYIQPNWPHLKVLGSFKQYEALAYRWYQKFPEDIQYYYREEWIKTNILDGNGPLCARYEAYDGTWNKHNLGMDIFRSEGDSPSFMYSIETGLRSMEDPTYGGWGGRFEKEPGTHDVWQGAKDDGDLYKPIWRWSKAYQNDWAARADWCVKSYDEANHPPVVELEHSADLTAAPGETLKLSASATDPDNDELTCNWWQYRDPGTYPGVVSIPHADAWSTEISVPGDAKTGQTIHIICEVTDNGNPELIRYQRVVVTVK